MLEIKRETHSENRCFGANAPCGQRVALKILAIGNKKFKKREMLIVKYITLVIGQVLSMVPRRCSSFHHFSAFDMQTVSNISICFA